VNARSLKRKGKKREKTRGRARPPRPCPPSPSSSVSTMEANATNASEEVLVLEYLQSVLGPQRQSLIKLLPITIVYIGEVKQLARLENNILALFLFGWQKSIRPIHLYPGKTSDALPDGSSH